MTQADRSEARLPPARSGVYEVPPPRHRGFVGLLELAGWALLGGWVLIHLLFPAPDRGAGWLLRLLIYLVVGVVVKVAVPVVFPDDIRYTPFGARGAVAAVFLGWWLVVIVRRGNPGTLTAWVVWVPFMAVMALVLVVAAFTPRELGGYITRRMMFSIPVILVASFLVYFFVAASGDPLAELRGKPNVSRQLIINKERELMLDRPVIVRYGAWLGRFVRGDFGTDNAGTPVKPKITRALSVTLQLVILSTLVAAVLAVILGVLAAVKQYSTFDYFATSLAFLGFSMPTFWLGLMLKQYVGIALPKVIGFKPFATSFETSPDCACTGWPELADRFSHLGLPVMVLSIVIVAQWSRFQRSAMLDVVNSDYVRTARAKGLSNAKVIFKHALRNALIPLVTVMTLDFAQAMGGAIVTETVFSWKGMGQLFIIALRDLDVNIVVGWMVVVALIVVVFNLVTDILYGFLDPRIRYD